MEKLQPRWKERLATFEHALQRLTEVVNLRAERGLNDYECDSLIKRFEFTYEMAWKLMMSYEKDNGIQLIAGSKDVVRHALSLTLIDNGEAWLDMIDARNRTSHTYDEEVAKDVADEIVYNYYPLLMALKEKMNLLTCTD